jgi:hypothetical protein
MADRPTTAWLLLAGATVLLSGISAFVGAGLAQREPVAAPAGERAAAGDPATVENLERRLGYVEERLRSLEESVQAALSKAASVERRLDSMPLAALSAPVPAKAEEPRPAAHPETPAERDAREAAERENEVEKLRGVYQQTARGKLVYDMKLLADASKEGGENRYAQAITETRALMNRFGLRGDDLEARVRQIYLDQFDAGARDVGPVVRDGLERADIVTVRDRLRTIHAETDRRVQPLLDDEQWREYQQAVGGLRKAAEAALAEFEKARLGTK